MAQWIWAAALLALASLGCALADPPAAQQTLAKPALLTADPNALTGPFGPGGLLDYYNKTPQVLEATLYPVEAYVVALGQLFTGLEPVCPLQPLPQLLPQHPDKTAVLTKHGVRRSRSKSV